MSAKPVQIDFFSPERNAQRKKPSKQEASDRILSVGEVTSKIKTLLEGSFPALWVRGEVSNLRKQSSGHVYFTLKDANSQLSVVLFWPTLSTAKLLLEGVELLVYGELGVYEPRGTYQLIARAVVPGGQGRLQLELMRLKELLEREGVFSNKKELPRLPGRVAVITSPTGAALQDMLSVLERRNWPGQISIIPAAVQGAEAAQSLKEALAVAEESDFELIIFARGGGSIEDLWCFNDEQLVRAIAASRVPTMSAVGHEIDFTLTDFAADLRCETPTAAAEWLCSRADEARGQVRLLRHRFYAVTMQIFQAELLRAERASQRWLRVRPTAYIEGRMQRLDELAARLETRVDRRFMQLGSRLSLYRKEIEPARLTQRLLNLNLRVSFSKKALGQNVCKCLAHRRDQLEAMSSRLENLGTQRTLLRGFTILQDASSGEYLTSVHAIHPEGKVRAIFHDGDAVF